MSETPRPTQAQTLAETALDQSTHLEVTFPDAPAYLTATEATATLSALTYLHDLALSQEHPDLLKGGLVEFERPRHRLRTPPESALRIARIHYGSPFAVELIIPTVTVVSILTVLIQQAGAIVKTAVQQRAETERERMRQDGETKREHLRQQGETQREGTRQREPEQPVEEPSSRTTGEVPSKLLPIAPTERAASGGDNIAYSPPEPRTVDDLAQAPQQMLRAIMTTPEANQSS